MILVQNIKNLILDKREKRIIHHRRIAEIDKINDPRRVKIAERVQLSKEQKEAIDEVYMKNYGVKSPIFGISIILLILGILIRITCQNSCIFLNLKDL